MRVFDDLGDFLQRTVQALRCNAPAFWNLLIPVRLVASSLHIKTIDILSTSTLAMDSAAQCGNLEEGCSDDRTRAQVMADLHLLAEAERAFRDSGRDLADVCGFTVTVAESTAPGAGRGVHLFGSAVEGAVVGVYRGTVVEMEDLQAMHALICQGNDYLMFRRDGVLIDGRDEGPSRSVFESALLREAAAAHVPSGEARQRAWDHPFAVGQLVNHTPAGRQPNVHAFPVDLYEDCAPELLSFLRWISVPFRARSNSQSDATASQFRELHADAFRGGSRGNHVSSAARDPELSEASSSCGRLPRLKAVVLRATREISNEELFLDYKFQTETLPEWYCPSNRTLMLHDGAS